MNPSGSMCRIPDSFSRPTALVRSIVELPVSVYFAVAPGTTNDGRFSVMARPILGSNNLPTNYAIAQTVGNAPWPIDMSAAAAYVSGGGVGGLDPRINPYMTEITQPPPAFWHADGNYGVPLGTEPFGNPTVNAASYGLNITLNRNNVANSFVLPPGQYEMMWNATTTGPGGNFVVSFIGNGVENNLATSSVVQVSTNTRQFRQSIININDSNTVLIITGNGTLPLTGELTFTPMFSPQTSQVAMDYGAARQIRPVAMSVLFTCSSSLLNRSGLISANWLPGGSDLTNFFTNSSDAQVGPLQNWECLAKTPTAYSGQLEKGAYCFWKPEDDDDVQFYQPSKALLNQYPSVVISGMYQSPPATLGTSVIIGRIEVVTIFEFETLSLLFELRPFSCPYSDLELALRFLGTVQQGSENGEHLERIKRFAKRFREGINKAVGFYQNNKSWINPVATSLASFLL